MSSQAYQSVRQAILSKKIVTASYNGLRRVMCPHTLGWKKGKEHGLFYQFAGETSSGALGPDGSADNWRCVDIEKLTGVQVSDGAWHTSESSHSKRQTCVDQVDVEVTH
jgi:hypothetical protein